MADLNVALVGKRAGSFIAGVQSIPGCTVSAVCEASVTALDALGDRTGVPAAARYLRYEDLLERAHPDVVILGTPMDLHVPQAIRALDSGIHVLSEVTAAVDDGSRPDDPLHQCRELVRAVQRAAARRNGRPAAQYMMSENYSAC